MKFAVILGAALVAATALTGPALAASPDIEFSAASVTPTTSTGPCPTTYTFKTTIKATNWSPTALKQIQYKWTRSDGADAPTQTATADATGAVTIAATTTWLLGAQGDFWEAVAISYPQSVTGPKLAFTNACGTGAAQPKPSAKPIKVRPSAEDCIGYDPKNLAAGPQGSDYLLSDGSMWMQRFASQAEANDGKTVAEHFSKQCFVGRNNTQSDRKAYIMEYWLGSGPGSAWPASEDCLPVDPANVVIASRNGVYYIDQGTESMVQLATLPDAERALEVIKASHGQCFIGRSDGGSGDARLDHIMHYLK